MKDIQKLKYVETSSWTPFPLSNKRYCSVFIFRSPNSLFCIHVNFFPMFFWSSSFLHFFSFLLFPFSFLHGISITFHRPMFPSLLLAGKVVFSYRHINMNISLCGFCILPRSRQSGVGDNCQAQLGPTSPPGYSVILQSSCLTTPAMDICMCILYAHPVSVCRLYFL